VLANPVSFGLALAALSALATAFAHAYLKAGIDKLAVQVWVRLTGFVFALPIAVLVGLPPVSLWPWLFAAAAIHAVYQLTLNRSYTLSDFSAAFPIARGVAPLLVALGGLWLLEDRMGPAQWIGITAIVASIGLIVHNGAISRAGLLAAALSGALTTIYTLVDAHGVREAPAPIIFIAWFYVLEGFTMPILFWRNRPKGSRRSLLRGERRNGLLAAIGALLAFVPALFAFRYAPAGAVSAIRETSLVGAMFVGKFHLGETPGWRHWISALGVAAGAVLLATAQ
jgi:drug/metabolite transporter (DMT)-like permease